MHLVETMAYAGERPWHGLGNKLASQQSIEVWRQQAGMDWQIEEAEVRHVLLAPVSREKVLLKPAVQRIRSLLGLGAVLGATLIGLSSAALPWGLALAAGARLFVISHEVIPESHRKGHERFATMGLMLGFVTMMMLDTALA